MRDAAAEDGRRIPRRFYFVSEKEFQNGFDALPLLLNLFGVDGMVLHIGVVQEVQNGVKVSSLQFHGTGIQIRIQFFNIHFHKLPPQNGLGDGSLENRIFLLSDLTNILSARKSAPLVPFCGLCCASGSNTPTEWKSPPERQVPPRWACSQKWAFTEQ